MRDLVPAPVTELGVYPVENKAFRDQVPKLIGLCSKPISPIGQKKGAAFSGTLGGTLGGTMKKGAAPCSAFDHR